MDPCNIVCHAFDPIHTALLLPRYIRAPLLPCFCPNIYCPAFAPICFCPAFALLLPAIGAVSRHNQGKTRASSKSRAKTGAMIIRAPTLPCFCPNIDALLLLQYQNPVSALLLPEQYCPAFALICFCPAFALIFPAFGAVSRHNQGKTRAKCKSRAQSSKSRAKAGQKVQSGQKQGSGFVV